EYLGRLYLESKGRPLFVIESILGQENVTVPSTVPIGVGGALQTTAPATNV
ncbi:MAG: hypothetical protein QOF90_879, partial [Acetobacteraceae bacterium]|nr:hypothetical protein [Acetobacteraceae bacterium]